MEETTTPEAPTMKAAFVIAIDADGHVYVERDPSVLKFPVEREATMIEIRRYISEILMDLNAQAAAEYVTARLTASAAE